MKIIDSKIIDSGFEKFNGQKILKLNLGYAAMRTLCTNTRREYVIDCSLNKKADRGTVLALALALKEYIQKKFPEYERIGIALPSCLPGIAVNLAVQLAGKVSVNLNFTMGAEAERSCLERANVKMIIGSKKVRDKVDSHSPDYPWTDNFFDIGDILKEIGKKRIAAKLVAVRLLPFWVLSRIYGIPRDGGDREASIIFTSGSEGMPKAAVLTHRNIMANCVQMWNIGLINSDTRLHANLPLFHSFGQTIQVWMTAIYGMQSVTVQSPLEVQANLEASRKYKSTIMISTPTFLRSYYKKGKPEDFPAMHGVIGGAEKTPEGFIEKWNEKFPNVYYWEGYGLTEASPVVAVNLPPNLKRGEFCPQPSQTKAESVGEIFPGMLAAVANPDTGEFLPVGSIGLLHLKGASIFGGYLNQPEENKKKLRDGWLNTGDLAALDEDGFIFIKGRISRFSKIGGEMVPHMSVEESIVKALGIQDSEVPLIAIGSRIDEAKGESLVLISSFDIEMAKLRRLLTEAGLPNLWIPKHLVRVDAIPLLSSGKLDLGKIRKLCAEGETPAA